MRVTVLGCGNSTGVPAIGCDCAVCRSDNPKNKRGRVSVLVEAQGKHILIDSSPDLRQQAIQNNIRRIDCVLYTHDHADHVNGIDDLRSFNYLSGKSLPVYGAEETLRTLIHRFPYIFQDKPDTNWYRPSLTPHFLTDNATGKLEIDGISIAYFKQYHAKVSSLGYRIGQFAYSTDVKELPETAFEALAGVGVWVVDCLRYKESRSHSHLEQTLAWIERVNPRLAILTHMDHDMDYDILSKQLPAGVVAAYDGMMIDV